MAKISVIEDKTARLAKKFSLNDNGDLIKQSADQVVDGFIETIEVDSLTALKSLIENLDQGRCLCLGHTAKPGKQTIKTQATASPGDLTRSKQHLHFSDSVGNLFALFDFDGCPYTPDEAIAILSETDPQITTASKLIVPSNSAYLYNTVTNSYLTGAGNFHIYVEIEGNPSTYSKNIFTRLIINGYGVPHITASGTVVVKSLFDVVVNSPERVIYEAEPVCVQPIESHRHHHIRLIAGTTIVKEALLKPISKEDDILFRQTQAKLRDSVKVEAAEIRTKYNEKRARIKAAANNSNYHAELAKLKQANTTYDREGRPIIELSSSDFILDENGNQVQIKSLLLETPDGRKLPDPTEPFIRGDEAAGLPGRGVATWLGADCIYSHAHCGIIYKCRWAVEDIVDIYTKGTNSEKQTVWSMISSGAQEMASTCDQTEISELADVIRSAQKLVKGAAAAKDKKAIVTKLKPATVAKEADDDIILNMNAKYGMAMISGKAAVIAEDCNEAGELFEAVFCQPASLDAYHKNEIVKVSNAIGGEISSYKYWEKSAERNTFSGVVFEPRADIFRVPGEMRVLQQGGAYNLFQGYILDKSKATSCDKIIAHIKEVWCSGIEAEFKYTLAWLAHLVQHPGEVSTTALVLQSVPGAGKNIIIDNIFIKIFGVHGISTANQEDIVGRFNSHMAVNIFMYANELAFSAKNSVKSTLKTLLTDEHRMIEAKGINKIKARNATSLIFSSNDTWLLSIESKDRRYVYLTVSGHRAGDKEYFKELYREISHGGAEAFFLMLLEYDYLDVDLSKIPNPNQKQRRIDLLRSAHNFVKFIYGLVDANIELNIYASDPVYQRLREWRNGSGELVLTQMQTFSLYIVYCEYFAIDRKYDDISTVIPQMEQAGILGTAVSLVEVSGRHDLKFKSFAECRKVLGF